MYDILPIILQVMIVGFFFLIMFTKSNIFSPSLSEFLGIFEFFPRGIDNRIFYENPFVPDYLNCIKSYPDWRSYGEALLGTPLDNSLSSVSLFLQENNKFSSFFMSNLSSSALLKWIPEMSLRFTISSEDSYKALAVEFVPAVVVLVSWIPFTLTSGSDYSCSSFGV
jgi:hypothetical protein